MTGTIRDGDIDVLIIGSGPAGSCRVRKPGFVA
jgi:hypothetical protein